MPILDHSFLTVEMLMQYAFDLSNLNNHSVFESPYGHQKPYHFFYRGTTLLGLILGDYAVLVYMS